MKKNAFDEAKNYVQMLLNRGRGVVSKIQQSPYGKVATRVQTAIQAPAKPIINFAKGMAQQTLYNPQTKQVLPSAMFRPNPVLSQAWETLKINPTREGRLAYARTVQPEAFNLAMGFTMSAPQGKVGGLQAIKQAELAKTKLPLKPTTPLSVKKLVGESRGVGKAKAIQLQAKLPVKPQASILKPEVSGKAVVSSKGIIPQNPTEPYFNIQRLNVEPEIKQVVKVAVEDSKPQIEKIVGKKLSNKEVVEFSNRSSQVLHRVVQRDETLRWESSMLKARQILANEAQSGEATPELINAMVAIKSQGTDVARKLQSLGIGADPQTITAKQAILEAVIKVTKNADDVITASKGVNFNDMKQATEFYRKFIKPSAEEWTDALRYNAMLSSPNTHMVNISSNIQGTGLVAPIEKTLTGTFDWLGSTITGKPRRYFAGEGAEYAKGYYSKLGEASKRFADVLSGRVMGKYPEIRDIPLATKGKAVVVEKILKFPQRALEAMDQFFTVLTESGSKRALEYRKAKGVSTINIERKATAEATKRLFRSEFNLPEEGPVLKSLEYIPSKLMEAKGSTNPIVRTVAKLSFPFVRIAVNLFKQGVEYSPTGLTTIPGAKEKLPQFTKAFMGAMVGVGAAMLASSDRITWARPTSKKQGELWDKGGMQEYSIKVGNHWVSYTKLHPLLAFNLATVAGVKSALENQKIDDATSDTILTSLWNVMRFYADQSYVKNIGDFIGATQQGVSALPKLMSNYWQQFVPYRAFMGWLARTLDPLQRTANQDAGMIQKQMEYFFMQIPGLRQTLPAKTGITGEPIENQNRFFNALSPAKITTRNEPYEKAYAIQKNIPKQQEAKKQAIGLYLSGDMEGFKKLVQDNNLQIKQSEIKSSQTSQVNKAANLYIEGNEDEFKKMVKENNLTVKQSDISKAAKKKAIELYNLGLEDEFKKLVQKYNLVIKQSEL